MHFHLPKPAHGWRALAGEIGIIVVGVLIALGAEHLVKAVDQRNELLELRSALDDEIAYGLGTADARLSQNSCLDARLTVRGPPGNSDCPTVKQLA